MSKARKPASSSRKPVSASPTLEFERSAGFPHSRVIGLDEVGRGCLAGPVVAAAVLLPAEWDLPLKKLIKRHPEIADITDSKAMTAKRRSELAPWIREKVAAFGIAHATVEEIDRLNIYHASHLAMKRAADAIEGYAHVLVDGNVVPKHFRGGAESESESVSVSESESESVSEAVSVSVTASASASASASLLTIGSTAIVKGDLRCLSIACASIIAKVFRDEWMRELAEKHPGYGLEVHKGYATPMHRLALRTLGATEIHRRSFGPVREALGLSPLGGVEPETFDELEQELNSPFLGDLA
jgi:ribonuclease HII